jgi:hypothetical protein
MMPLIHISTKNDFCYDKNVIVLIADFLVEYFDFNANHWFSVRNFYVNGNPSTGKGPCEWEDQ